MLQFHSLRRIIGKLEILRELILLKRKKLERELFRWIYTGDFILDIYIVIRIMCYDCKTLR